MAELKVTTKQTTTQQDLDDFIELLSTAYQTVPLTTALITEIDNVSPAAQAEKLSPQRLKQHFGLGLPAAFKSNVLLTTVTSPSSRLPLAAVLFEPPDFSGTPPSHARKAPGRTLTEYRAAARMFKARYLAMPETGPHQWDTPASPSQASSGPSGDPYPNEFNKDINTEVRPFYHLSLLARNTAADAGQAAQAVKLAMQEYLDKAKKEDVPILLEATSPESKAEFEKFGFKSVGDVGIGVGRVNRAGWPTENGEGIDIWAMLYNA